MYEASPYAPLYQATPWYVELWQDWLAMFRGDGFEIALGILLGLMALSVLLAVACGIFYAADKWFTPLQEGRGRILKRWIRPGYWQATTKTEWKYHYSFSNGKYEYGPVSVPGPDEWVPDQPMVEVALDEGAASEEFEVTQAAYDVAGMQRPVLITFQRGRMSGAVYIRSYESA